MVTISLELTRVNTDQNIFFINVELTSTFFTLQRYGPSPSPNFKFCIVSVTKSYVDESCNVTLEQHFIFHRLYLSSIAEKNVLL